MTPCGDPKMACFRIKDRLANDFPTLFANIEHDGKQLSPPA